MSHSNDTYGSKFDELFGIQKLVLSGGAGGLVQPTSKPLKYNLIGDVWRADSMQSAKIPAGYTYLAQLMGHDLGHTIALETFPYVKRSNSVRAQLSAKKDRYNLNENPLTLETIYGKGPAGTPHLYSQHNALFNLKPYELRAPEIRYNDHDNPMPLLYDQRNNDTTILHRLVVIWMQLHNKIARHLMALSNISETDPLISKEHFNAIHIYTRGLVIQLWHRVLLDDLLPNIADNFAVGLSLDELKGFNPMDDISLLNGIMRSFHSMPLDAYTFIKGHAKKRIVDLRPHSAADNKSWTIDWKNFLDPNAPNLTGICASYSRFFTNQNGVPIHTRDATRSNETGPMYIKGVEFLAEFAKLPATHQENMSPANILTKFNAKALSLGLAPITVDDLAEVPLFMWFMLEAEFFGTDGKFGPLGSTLLRRYLVEQIGLVTFEGDALSTFPVFNNLTSMSDIIQYLEF